MQIPGLFRRKQESHQINGLSIERERVSFVSVNTKTGISIEHAATLPIEEQDWQSAFSELVNTHGIKGDVYVCLAAEQYNLLLIDAPDVPEEELSEAIKWRVKDLITQPIEDVVIDSFSLPDDAYRGRMKMVYAAVVEKVVVQQVVDLCESHGLELKAITIAELAVSNLLFTSGLMEEGSAALVSFDQYAGQVRLVESGNVYLSRNVDIGLDRLSGLNEETLGEYDYAQINEVMMDVQRSLDFYESQLGKGHVEKIVLLPAPVDMNKLAELLNEKMSVTVESWHWYSAENYTLKLPEIDALDSAYYALGAVAGGWLEN